MHTRDKSNEVNWDHYALCYDALRTLVPYQELLSDVMRSLNPNATRVLDAGCGTGNLLEQLATPFPTSVLWGIDMSAAMLRRAAQKLSTHNVALQHCDLQQRLPFADQHFDAVTCVNVLYALADPAVCLQEIARVLQPGGQLVLASPHQGYESGLTLKAHCESSKPDSYWSDAHQSLAREKTLITTAIRDPELVEQMLYVAKHNRRITASKTFWFFTDAELVDLCHRCGFAVDDCTRTYAQQNILITARKE